MSIFGLCGIHKDCLTVHHIDPRIPLRDAIWVDGVAHVKREWGPLKYLRHLYEMGRIVESPPTMEAFYAYTGETPMVHQILTVREAIYHPRLGILNGVGTGKTLAAIWAMKILIDAGKVDRVMVVAPFSLLQRVWMAEMLKCGIADGVSMVVGTAAKRAEIVKDRSRKILMINPDGLRGIVGIQDLGIDLFIVDEAAWFKHASSQRAVALARMSAGARAWFITGTPASQRPEDAHGLISLIKDGKFMNMYSFRSRICTKAGPFAWRPRPEAQQIIASHLLPAVRFRREDCFDLPQLQTLILEVPLDPDQERVIGSLRDEAIATLKCGEKIVAANAAVVLSKIFQVMAGVVYAKDGVVISIEAAPMWEAVRSVVMDSDGPVLAFSSYASVVDLGVKYMQGQGLRAYGITGTVPKSEQQRIIAMMEAGDLDILLATPQMLAEGHTFIKGNVEVWITPPMKADFYEQGVGRIYRYGQERPCTIYQVVQDYVASRFFARIRDKKGFQDDILALLER